MIVAAGAVGAAATGIIPLDLRPNTSYHLTIRLVCQDSGATESAAYTFTALARQGAGDANTELLGLTKTIISQNLIDASAAANVGTGDIDVTVSNEHGAALRCVATFEWTEVNYA